MLIFRSINLRFGLKFTILLVGGMSLYSSARVAFIMLVRPLTPSLCPIFGLFELTSKVCLEVVEKAFDRALISIGSPTGVPVPWVCMPVNF